MKNNRKTLRRIALTCALGALLIATNGLLSTGILAGSLASMTPPVAVAETEAIEVSETEGDLQRTVSPTQEIENELFDEMEETHGEYNTWSLETRAEYSARKAKLGIEELFIVHGLPSADDLTEDEAIAKATEIVRTEMNMTEETMKKFKVDTAFDITDPDMSVWRIGFMPIVPEDYEVIGQYLCLLNAKTGELVELYTPENAVG